MHFSNMLRIKTETEKREDDERCKTDASTHILDSSLCAGDFLNFSAIKELLVSFFNQSFASTYFSCLAWLTFSKP